MRRADCQIKIRNSFLAQKSFIGSIAIQNAGCFSEPFRSRLCKLIIRVNYYNVLGRGKIHFGNSFENRNFLRLDDFFRNQSSNSSRADNRDFFKFPLSGTTELHNFAYIFFFRKNSKRAAGLHFCRTASQQRFSVQLNVGDQHIQVSKGFQLHQLMPCKNAFFSNSNAAYLHFRIVKGHNVADRAIFNCLYNRFRRLYIGMNHKVNSIERPVLSAKSICVRSFCRRGIHVIGIVPYAGNL